MRSAPPSLRQLQKAFAALVLLVWGGGASRFFQKCNSQLGRTPRHHLFIQQTSANFVGTQFSTPSKTQNDPKSVSGRSKTLKWHPKRVSGRSKMGPRELPKHPRRPSGTHPGTQDAPRTAGRAIHAARAGPNEGPRGHLSTPDRPRPPPLSTLHEGERWYLQTPARPTSGVGGLTGLRPRAPTPKTKPQRKNPPQT